MTRGGAPTPAAAETSHDESPDGSPRVRLRFGDFELNTASGALTRDGTRVPLQPRVHDTLRLLLERRGELVSRKALLDALWKDVVVGEEAVTQTLRKLRRALADEPKTPTYVETVPKRGYRFIAAVEVIPIEPPASPAPRRVEQGASPVATPPVATAPVVTKPAPTPAPPPSQVEPSRLLRTSGRVIGIGLALLGLVASEAAPQPRDETLLPAPPPTPEPLAAAPIALPARLTFGGGRPQDFDLSADGATAIVTERGNDGRTRLVRLDVATGARTPQTQPEDADDSAGHFVPTTPHVVFTRTRAARSSVWLSSGLGGSERVLLPDARLAVPDREGGRLAAVERQGAAWIVTVRTRSKDATLGEARVVHHTTDAPTDLRWSSDGGRLAWIEAEAPWVADLGAATAEAIAGRIAGARTLAWHRDGRELVVDGTAGLRRIDSTTKTSGVLATLPTPFPVHSPRLTPDGTQVLYIEARPATEVWIRDPQAPRERVLDLKSTVDCISPDPVGPRLAVFDTHPQGLETALAWVDLASGRRHDLGSARELRGCPTLVGTAAGGRGALAVAAPERHGIWWLPLDGTTPPRHHLEDLEVVSIAASPHDGRLAVATLDGLVVVSPDLATRRRVDETSWTALAWSPDGQRIAGLATGPEEGTLRVLVPDATDPSSSTVVPVPGAAPRFAPLWAGPAAVDVVVERGPVTSLQRVDVDGTPERRAGGAGGAAPVPTVLLFDRRDHPGTELAAVHRGAGASVVYLLRRVDGDLMALPSASFDAAAPVTR